MLSPDLHEHLIEVPDIAQPTLTTLEILGVLGAELPTPLPDGLVGNKDSTFRQELLDVSEA